MAKRMFPGALRIKHPFKFYLSALALGWALFAPPLAAEDMPEAEMKLSFLYNFLKMTAWPNMEQVEHMEICVANSNPFEEVQDILNNQKAQKRPVSLLKVESGQDLSECQLLYIPARQRLDSWLRQAADKPILTVSDQAGFIDQGGMIGLIIQGSKLRFEVNLDATQHNHLRLQTHLLQLAIRIVGNTQ